MAAVEFRNDQRGHLDPVDRQPIDLTIDLGTSEVGAADVGASQIDLTKPGILQVRPDDLGPAQVRVVELAHNAGRYS